MSKKMDRRNFLKLAGTTAFAVSVTSVLGGCSEVPDAPSLPHQHHQNRLHQVHPVVPPAVRTLPALRTLNRAKSSGKLVTMTMALPF